MIRPAPPACPAGRRDPKSQDFPHSFYLLLAHLEVILIPGEDFEGDGFIVSGLFELFDNSFEIDDPGTGIKQLEGDPFAEAGELKKGTVVTCEVTEVKEAGLEAKIVGTDLTTFIRRAELARDRAEQRPERFAVGQKVDARVTQFDRRTHKVQVSIKALEVAEEKEAIAQYGSSDSGATLGDILGTALKQRATEKKD